MTMPMGVSVNPTVHDLNLNFNDSCNCCCFGKKRPKDSDQIVIRKDGSYEKWDPKKAKDILEAQRKTIERLEAQINQLSMEAKLDSSQVKHNITRESGLSFDEPISSPLSYKKLKDINSVFLRILEKPRVTFSSQA